MVFHQTSLPGPTPSFNKGVVCTSVTTEDFGIFMRYYFQYERGERLWPFKQVLLIKCQNVSCTYQFLFSKPLSLTWKEHKE